MIAASAMNAILRNPDLKGKLMTFMILFIALDETVAIYGLIVALQIL
ncbi:ATP synthase F0 subunit C [bacterium]|jgi:F0F1-type ATP synthase membrane subunit c/vacuolar-type H+-ATPase subunit K|nr:ATP synthase F0 subunit C [bacterium]MBR4567825.1 ATP synthase F0 subunit C [bacterium]